MVSEVSICNMALGNLGKDGINSLDEASAQALACRCFYGAARDELLSLYPWHFARKQSVLADLGRPPSSQWKHACRRPVDCLKISALSEHPFGHQGRTHHAAFELIGETILCDVSPAFLDYTARITDPAFYPPLFIEALSWSLAARLTVPMLQDPRLRADSYQMAAHILRQASAHDAREARECFDLLSQSDEVGRS